MDNQFDFSLNPSKYILPPSDPNPTKNTYSLGNGQFQLRYEPATTCTPGQMGNLYCKGMVGTATREVKITDFGALIDMVNGNALLRNPSYAPTQWKLLNDWGGPMSFPVPIYFNGWTVAFYMCGIWMYGGQGNGYVPVNWVRPENQPPPVGDGSGTLSPSFTVAVSYPPGHPCQVNPPQSGTPCANPLKLGRLVVGSFDAVNADPAFVWDEVCDRHGSLYNAEELTVPHWDGVTIPPPAGQFLRPAWNTDRRNEYPYGKRHYDSHVSNYCYHGWPETIDAGTLWNSETYPLRLDFSDPLLMNRPPAGTKYYIGLATAVNDKGVWRTVENRWVFTADP